MSKWEDSFKKKAFSAGEIDCQCDKQYGLFLSNRQLSGVIAGLLFLFFTLFITGYFFGKQYAVEQFTYQVQGDADRDRARVEVAFDAHNNDEILSIDRDTDTLVALEDISENKSNELEVAVMEQGEVQNQKTVQYYAQLIGFGTEKAAQQFVQKIALKNIETMVKKHTSKTAKGRIMNWYQVVTVPYNNKDELSHVVMQLTKDEKLKDVVVRAC